MPVTQALNSKANVKKFTNQDLPFSPAQPVMSSYYATSTASQTVINLSFSVNQSLTDQFFLFVDGKKLRPGAGNDYVFTSIGADNSSSQVTLSQSIVAGLNIQAFQLGLKNEVEFQTDNRFVQLYDAQGAGFQNFVNTTSFLRTATAATGTPGSGNYHSIIPNRPAMVDLAQDLKVNMGIERIQTEQLIPMLNEYGPNGEPVFGIAGDTFGQVRLIGGGWTTSTNLTYGQYVVTSTVGDSIEITFYGTGLNMLMGPNGGLAPGATYFLDGVSQSTNIFPQTHSIVTSQKNLNVNTNYAVASGLTLGVHTIRIAVTAITSMFVNLMGFEILNENAVVRVNPGVGYVQGKRFTSANQSTFAHNAMATGTRGGRTVVYQNGDGTIGTAWQAVNAAQANLTAADHTNEEVIRSYNYREFGAGTSGSDFSGGAFNTNNGQRMFTLEDGTTSLSTSTFYPVNLPAGQPEGVGVNTTNDFIILTFVGTGLDVYQTQTVSGLTSTDTIQIDGTTIVNAASNTIWKQGITKIVSGLPYGTHTFYYAKSVAGSGAAFSRFIVYGAKKPTIPSGTVELADYNVMANYTFQSSNNSPNLVSQGALYKMASREIAYTGANWAITYDSAGLGGQRLITTGNGQTASYNFWGTGVEYFHWATLNEGVKAISIDGVLLTAANFPGVTVQVTTGLTYNNTNGQVSGAPNTTGSKVSITGLTLGKHSISLNKISGTQMEIEAFGVITPIHSHKTSSQNIQNSLPIGSQSIGDTRKFSPVKNESPVLNQSSALGVTSNPTTSSTAFVPLPDMSVTINSRTGKLKVSYAVTRSNSVIGNTYIQVVIDGLPVGLWTRTAHNAGYIMTTSDSFNVNVSPGFHKVDLYWLTDTGTATATETLRKLLVEEIR